MRSLKSKRQRKKDKSSTRQFMMQYIVSLAGSIVILTFSIFVLSIIRNMRSSYYGEYGFLDALFDYMEVIYPMLAVFIGISVSLYFVYKISSYLNEIVVASGELISPSDREIVLSRQLRSQQDQLNLIREQALRAKYLLQESESRKTDLIMYLAHDLKTPLTSVIGYLSLINDEKDISDEVRQKYINIALEKSERLEMLINEFFDITRFSLSNIVLEKEKVDLSMMLEQIIFEFEPMLIEKNLKIRCSIKEGVSIVCDIGKMERVFDNLIRNAINYSYENTSIDIEMKVLSKSIMEKYVGRFKLQDKSYGSKDTLLEHGRSSDSKIVYIGFKNLGKTIPKEKLEKVFEQFYRVDSSRSTKSGGSGLGLAISKEIIQQHGGKIGVESENEMTTFYIMIPLESKENL